jgi:hypothetical protein
MSKDQTKEPEIHTHAAGIEDMHKTIHKNEVERIEEPEVATPGPYDTRGGRFKLDGDEDKD